MRKNFISFVLIAFAVLLTNTCFATSYNKVPDVRLNPSSDSAYAIEPSSSIVNKKTNELTSAYSDSQLWVKNQLGERDYNHYLQKAIAKKITHSDKKNLKLDYFLNSDTQNKTPIGELGQADNISSRGVTDEFTDISITSSLQIENPPSPIVASLASKDNDLKEYINKEISQVELVNPFSTEEEESIFDFINLDDDNLLLIAKGLIGMLALLAIFVIFKKIMQ